MGSVWFPNGINFVLCELNVYCRASLHFDGAPRRSSIRANIVLSTSWVAFILVGLSNDSFYTVEVWNSIRNSLQWLILFSHSTYILNFNTSTPAVIFDILSIRAFGSPPSCSVCRKTSKVLEIIAEVYFYSFPKLLQDSEKEISKIASRKTMMPSPNSKSVIGVRESDDGM